MSQLKLDGEKLLEALIMNLEIGQRVIVGKTKYVAVSIDRMNLTATFEESK